MKNTIIKRTSHVLRDVDIETTMNLLTDFLVPFRHAILPAFSPTCGLLPAKTSMNIMKHRLPLAQKLARLFSVLQKALHWPPFDRSSNARLL